MRCLHRTIPPSIFLRSKSIQIGEMRDSTIIQASDQSTVYATVGGIDSATLLELTKQLREALAGGAWKTDADRAEVSAQLDTLETQAKGRRPNRAIVFEAAKSLRTILEGTAANVAASGILEQIDFAWRLITPWRASTPTKRRPLSLDRGGSCGSKTFAEGPLGFGLTREVPGLLANLIEFLNAPDPEPTLVEVKGGGQVEVRDDREPALREELRRMITRVQAGTYQPGSFDDKITLSYRIHRTSHRRADGLGGYEVHTEVDGDTRAEMLYAVYQAMSSGDLARVTLCRVRHSPPHAPTGEGPHPCVSQGCRPSPEVAFQGSAAEDHTPIGRAIGTTRTSRRCRGTRSLPARPAGASSRQRTLRPPLIPVCRVGQLVPPASDDGDMAIAEIRTHRAGSRLQPASASSRTSAWAVRRCTPPSRAAHFARRPSTTGVI